MALEDYNKWRKMVFDVAKEKFNDYLFSGNAKVESDCILYDKGFGFGNYGIQGICSYNTEKLEKFSFNGWACLSGNRMPSKNVKTAHLTYSKNLAKIMVCYASIGVIYQKFTQFFQITIEGVKVAFAPEKTKFFMHDGYDYDKSSCGFATFKDLASDGFNIPLGGSTFTFTTHAEDPLITMYTKKGKVDLRNPFSSYLQKTIPKLVELYKDNEELYEDAIDDICDEYPNE